MGTNSKIVWLTGLSGSGKSTLAKNIKKKILKKKYKVLIIDGDKFRKKQNNVNNFTKKNIILNNLKIIKYISKIKSYYDFIIVSVISPLKYTRQKAFNLFKEKYYEIYLKCNIKTLEKRDTKGLYSLAKKNIIKNLIGYKSKIKYEESHHEKLTIDTSKNNLTFCSNAVIKHILKNDKNV